jgi:hypothetical protein
MGNFSLPDDFDSVNIPDLHRKTLTEAERQRLNELLHRLLDWDIVVDDTRVELDAAVIRLQRAVAQRNHVATEVAELIARAA